MRIQSDESTKQRGVLLKDASDFGVRSNSSSHQVDLTSWISHASSNSGAISITWIKLVSS